MAREQPAIRGHHPGFRQALHGRRRRAVLRGMKLRNPDGVPMQKFAREIEIVVEGHADHGEARLEIREALQIGHFATAGFAPGGPEIDDAGPLVGQCGTIQRLQSRQQSRIGPGFRRLATGGQTDAEQRGEGRADQGMSRLMDTAPRTWPTV